MIISDEGTLINYSLNIELIYENKMNKLIKSKLFYLFSFLEIHNC